ncbi:MAG: PilX N-terminal domain-containing pilus assembly protein [Kiritimatiellales bacterium]
MREKDTGKGFVLVVALVITLVVGIIAVSLIGLTLQEYRLSSKSSSYSKALHAAESGVALACENFVGQIAAGGSVSPFTVSGDLTNMSGTVISSYNVSATPSGSDIFVITSTGTCSLASGTINRTIRVKIQAIKQSSPFFKYGALSAGPLTISGSALFDSFDSTDPAKSTNGQYDPAKAGTSATLATLSSGSTVTNGKKVTVSPAFLGEGAALVKGNVAVGVGGTITLTGSANITGTRTTDAFQAITNVVVPFSPSSYTNINVGPWPNQAQTITVSGSQVMSVSNLLVTASGQLTFNGSGTLKIYVKALTTVSGAGWITIAPTNNLKVEIYANGTVDISGSGMVNNSSRAANCAIWGTTNCTSISVTGNGAYIGTIYAPQAAVGLTGSSTAIGAFVGKSVTFGGNTPYHIDTSLFNGDGGSGGSGGSSGSSKLYKRVEWVETTGS